jgi:hypothetical protein
LIISAEFIEARLTRLAESPYSNGQVGRSGKCLTFTEIKMMSFIVIREVITVPGSVLVVVKVVIDRSNTVFLAVE